MFAQHCIPVDVRHVVQILQLGETGNTLLDVYAQQLKEGWGAKKKGLESH